MALDRPLAYGSGGCPSKARTQQNIPTGLASRKDNMTVKRRGIVCVASTMILATFTQAQSSGVPLRAVRGQTIVSKGLPSAEFNIGKDFRYIGGQQVNLYGNADAEQHIFVKAGSDGIVERFYWLQFEHLLPTNTHTYDYRGGTIDIGGLTFIYDVKTWPDYAANETEDPASDGAAISRLLAQHNLAFPKKSARVRMFHLPTPDHRTELMIIYGEALPERSAVPVRAGGVQLDKESPDSAQIFLDHMRSDMTIRKP